MTVDHWLVRCLVRQWELVWPLSEKLMLKDLRIHCETPKMVLELLTVSKKSSNLQWNCGEMHPMCKFKTKLTFLACDELGPKLIPRRARGDQCGIDTPEASSFCSANTGHPKVCIRLILTPIWIELKSSSQDVPSSRIDSVL
jgi:hypothetical protein